MLPYKFYETKRSMKQVSYKNMFHRLAWAFGQHYSQKTSDHLLEDEDENTIYYSKIEPRRIIVLRHRTIDALPLPYEYI